MRATDASGRGIAPIRAEVMLASDVSTDKVRSVYSSYVQESSREGTHLVRVGLRSTSLKNVVENITVYLHYFSDNVSDKRIEPEELAVQKVSVQRVGSDTVYIDFPPVSTSMETDNYSYYIRRSVSYGDKFYGIILSVLDEKSELILQSASTSVLQSYDLGKLK